ncbi:uncharacterized protein LOC142330559 isoform X2 [Lycorma delicatula]|uniref:uncharacterized protein LOC142330559 isoform X2 n=1 Tax=Lycorma delicatula TaxID=130591 RepID=UPI003F50EDB9
MVKFINCSFTRLTGYKIPKLLYLVFAQLVGILGPALIPPFHIAALYYFWRQFSRRVDKRYCSCSCWDTVFKGSYESGVASYKHIYFNATTNTAKIWILTVIFIIAFYESCSYLTLLAVKRRLRYSMLILFLSAIFSHYYSWWSYFNYLNDDFYSQWNHQLFFSCTELLSTGFVLYLANKDVSFSSFKALCIVIIATIHVIAGGMDQFVMNVVMGEGNLHQIIRDINLMIPDFLHIILPLLQLRMNLGYCNHKGSKCSRVMLCSLQSQPNLKKEYLMVRILAFPF